MIKTLKRYKEWKSSLNKRNKKLLSILTFLIKFAIASLPLYAIYFSNLNFRLLEDSEAFLTNSLLKAIGFKVKTFETISPDTGFKIPAFKIGKTVIGIDRPCTGYRSYFAFLGLLFATPKVKIKKKLKGALFGGLVIYFINILRLWVTGIIGFYSPKALGWVDDLLWGWGLLFLILALWLLWLRGVASEGWFKKWSKIKDFLGF